MKITKKIYMVPQVSFELILDDSMTEIRWSGEQEEEGFAKGSFVDTEFDEEDPLLPAYDNRSGSENGWK